MKLFTTAKTPLFLDAIHHGLEKRRGEDVKVVTLVLRAQPFDAKLATAMDNGVRATLFSLNNAEPKAHLRRVDFALGVPRQQLKVFAAPDTTEASIALDQAKIGGTYARSQKDVAGFAFIFRASLGPCGRQELEFIQDWHLSQRFVTFQEAEPGMFDDDGDDEDDEVTDADEKARRSPMWDEGDERNPSRTAEATKDTEAAKKEPVRRRLHSHAAGKTGTKRPDNARGLRRRRHK